MSITNGEIDNIIETLIKTDCIKMGNYILKNGDISKYYFDIKNIISNPPLLRQIGDALYKLLPEFDIICGIPYGGLPIATYISTQYNKPLIYVRDKKKAYGSEKMIEGTYKNSDRCVIVDDVITSGISLRDCILQLKDEVIIINVAVVLNRQQNGVCTSIIENTLSNNHLNTDKEYSKPIISLLYKNDITRYRLKQLKTLKKSRLCFAADIENPVKLLEMLNKIGKHIVICKIHYDIINLEDYQGNFISDLITLSIEHDFLIMEDRKFVDISSIVAIQYRKFYNWADLITVHASVSTETISLLSGALIVANMSNNTYDLTDKAIQLANSNPANVIGFITQKRISSVFVCMTPGIALNHSVIGDQKYNSISDVDTDYIIVGRALYNSENIEEEIVKYL